MNNNVRIFFSKRGRAVYISHLDLYRVFQRAVKRCKLPVWETQGFNPHIYITFALPLALGTEGVCESLDTKLTEELSFEEIRDRLNSALPRDIRILYADEPKIKPTEIAESEYEVNIDCDFEKLNAFFLQEQIITEKKTKKGISEIDLKPHIRLLELKEGFVRMRLPSGTEFNINANLVFDAFEKQFGGEIGGINIKRTGIYCKNGENFA